MRKRDKEIARFGKAAKTLTLDKVVLLKLEERAKQEKTTSSNIVNILLRRYILTDPEYYKELARFHYLEMQKYRYMKEECINSIEVGR